MQLLARVLHGSGNVPRDFLQDCDRNLEKSRGISWNGTANCEAHAVAG